MGGIQSKLSLAPAGLTCHGTLRALPSGRAKPGWSQQGQLCWLCGWAEQPQVTALFPSKALLARRRELRVSAAPQLLWDGEVQCIPFPCNSPWSWSSVLTSWTWWYRLNSKRDWGAASPCSWQRQSHGHPPAGCSQQVKVELHPCGKDGFMGWNLNRGKKLPLLYTSRKYQPPIQDNSPEQQMPVKHGNKGSNSAPTHAKKTPKPNQITAPVLMSGFTYRAG